MYLKVKDAIKKLEKCDPEAVLCEFVHDDFSVTMPDPHLDELDGLLESEDENDEYFSKGERKKGKTVHFT